MVHSLQGAGPLGLLVLPATPRREGVGSIALANQSRALCRCVLKPKLIAARGQQPIHLHTCCTGRERNHAALRPRCRHTAHVELLGKRELLRRAPGQRHAHLPHPGHTWHSNYHSVACAHARSARYFQSLAWSIAALWGTRNCSTFSPPPSDSPRLARPARGTPRGKREEGRGERRERVEEEKRREEEGENIVRGHGQEGGGHTYFLLVGGNCAGELVSLGRRFALEFPDTNASTVHLVGAWWSGALATLRREWRT